MLRAENSDDIPMRYTFWCALYFWRPLYSEDVEKGEVKTSGRSSCCKNGKKAAYRCGRWGGRSGLQMPGVAPGAKLARAACLKFSLGQRFEGQAVELSWLRDVESGSCFWRSRSWSIREGGSRSYTGGNCDLVCQPPERAANLSLMNLY